MLFMCRIFHHVGVCVVIYSNLLCSTQYKKEHVYRLESALSLNYLLDGLLPDVDVPPIKVLSFFSFLSRNFNCLLSPFSLSSYVGQSICLALCIGDELTYVSLLKYSNNHSSGLVNLLDVSSVTYIVTCRSCIKFYCNARSTQIVNYFDIRPHWFTFFFFMISDHRFLWFGHNVQVFHNWFKSNHH